MSLLKKISAHVATINGPHDSLFITCASYEERSALATRKLSSNYRTERAIIFVSREYRSKGKTSEHLKEISELLEKRSAYKPIELEFSIQNPIESLRNFRRVLGDFGESKPFANVTLDISTFPRQELLVLLRFLDQHPQRGVIRLLYGEPQSYASEAPTQDDRWLTRGVRSVQSVAYFGGIQLPRRSKLLVIILGHEGERTHIMLRRHQPDKLILIPQGRDQHHDGLKEIAERENQQIMAIYGPHSLWSCGLPSRGVVETEAVINEIYGQHRYSYNMFLAVNGTKLQLIGAYLTCRCIPEIQITYAVPAVYNWENYSTGSGPLSEMILEPLALST